MSVIKNTFHGVNEIRFHLMRHNRLTILLLGEEDKTLHVKSSDGWSTSGLFLSENDKKYVVPADVFAKAVYDLSIDAAAYEFRFEKTDYPYTNWTYMKLDGGEYSVWPGDEFGQRFDGTLSGKDEQLKFESRIKLIEFMKSLEGVNTFSCAVQESIIEVKDGNLNNITQGSFSLDHEIVQWKKSFRDLL